MHPCSLAYLCTDTDAHRHTHTHRLPGLCHSAAVAAAALRAPAHPQLLLSSPVFTLTVSCYSLCIASVFLLCLRQIVCCCSLVLFLVFLVLLLLLMLPMNLVCLFCFCVFLSFTITLVFPSVFGHFLHQLIIKNCFW